jgi:two-component system LytT family response regulator
MGMPTTAEGHIGMMTIPRIRAVIADDEQLSREKLRLLLAREADVQVVAECVGVDDTVRALESYRPDVLLLDIQMEGGTGFDVLRSLPPSDLPIVIFTTAYDTYALQAFDAQALDYVLKPFDQERLHRAMDRARAEMLKSASSSLNANLMNMLSTGKRTQPQQRENRLVIKSGGRVVFIPMDEVEWIEAAANYVRLHVTGKTAYLFREAIGRMAEKLDTGRFIRIHRSYIVNIEKIKELQPCNNGEFMVLLRNGKELPCSRYYRHGLEALWKDQA